MTVEHDALDPVGCRCEACVALRELENREREEAWARLRLDAARREVSWRLKGGDRGR